MAGENLETSLVIKDEASDILKDVEKQSDETGEALANVLEALKALESVGQVTIKTDIAADEKADKRKSAQEIQSGSANPEAVAPPPQENIMQQEDEADAGEEAIVGEHLQRIEEAAKSIDGSISEAKATLNEAEQAIIAIKNAIENASAPAEQIKEIQGKIDEAAEVNLSNIDEAIKSVLETIESANEAIEEQSETVKEAAEDAGDEWKEAMDEAEDAANDIEREVKKTGKRVKKGILGIGANIGGWWTIIKDVINKLGETFSKLAQESDKLNTRIARYGLVADSEGKTGDARGARSQELYKQHQKFAQALGVQSEAFNETVLNMYSNGAGVVKSIEDAQTIAASSYMAMDIAGLSGRDKDAVMGEVQSMISVGIADPDQIQESMKIAPNILRTIEKQWEKNMNGRSLKLNDGTEIKDATGKIAVLAQEGQITAELVAQAMINSAKETNETWKTLPSTWEKLKNRVIVITENMTAGIVKKFGELADDPRIANFITSALEFGQDVVNFFEKVIIPVVGGALMGILSIMTTIFDVLKNWYTAVPVLLAVGAVLVQVGIKTGLLAKAFGALKIVLTAISANPMLGILGAVLLVTFAVAHLVKTTQTGQEIMLEVTAAVSLAFQQVGTAIMNLPGIIKSAFRGLGSYIYGIVTEIQNWIAGLLEKLGKFSDAAKEAAKDIRANIAKREELQKIIDKESEEVKKEWKPAFEKNYDFYKEYREKIPKIAAENLTKSKDELKLTGFLDSVLKNQKNAPGTKNNPATVKGKVSIDNEYFEIIKRAAGVEIVNRYTTLRPTVNAKFGDIHKVDAQDILDKLERTIKEAEGASISDAQALGA